MEAIRTRRSIRRYKPDPIPEEKLMRVLEAARLAPSAFNLQPWQLIIVRDQRKREKLASLCPRGSFLRESSVAIVGVGDPKTSPDFFLIDTVIALENLVIAAADEGLGTCWIGLFDESGIKSLLNIPPEHKVVALLALGVPAEIPAPKPKKSLEQLVRFE
jgi:nitroreductase